MYIKDKNVNENRKMRKRGDSYGYFIASLLAIGMIFVFLSSVIAQPVQPGSINVTANETYSGTNSGTLVNISGGRIATLNISATIQNPHWKAFAGWVNGVFSLRDSSGFTIYDWSLSVSTGQVYATRNSSTITWATVNCSNNTYMESENDALHQTNTDDNITATFDDTTHTTFFVGSTQILANSCPTTSTYVNNVSQDVDFEEVVLYDSTSTSTIYATIVENAATGFDGVGYDFQMLVPDNGSSSWTSSIPYYVYVEVS